MESETRVREPSQGEAIKPQHGARRTWDCQDGGDAAFQRQAGQGEGMAVEVGDGGRDRFQDLTLRARMGDGDGM